LQEEPAVVRIRLAALLLLLGLAARCGHHSVFVERSFLLGESRVRYRVFLPPGYSRLRRWPVILFLHGSGERGDDNVRQIAVGLGDAVREFPQRFRSIVVFPQAPFGEEWYGGTELEAMAALNQAIVEFRGDRQRIYLTGISMGGAGAWYMARHRKLFAAVVPVCGEVVRQPDDPFPSELPPDLQSLLGAPDPYGALAGAIGTTPIWMFHGADDPVVPVAESRRMFEALQKAGGNARYTEYPDSGHEAWLRAYADPALPAWLLQQRLR
jgi:predicted peptidase